jgi:hypothetical protein
MRSSLRSGGVPGRVAALALALCLVAPPLAHTHTGAHVPTAKVAGLACPVGGSHLHLHPAATTAAPPCPACAAGPTSVSAPAPHDEVRASAGSEPVPAAALSFPPDIRRAPSRSRAPPRFPAA